MNQILNHGFIEPTIEEDNYIFGAKKLPDKIIKEDGQWGKYLPVKEIQKQFGIETSNCTGYGTLNALEILSKATIFDVGYIIEENWSDRALGVMAGTYPPGNNPHVVGETIRKKGLLDEADYPFEKVSSVDGYYSPLSNELIDKALKWLDDYDFGHEWVFKGKLPLKTKQNLLIQALKRSPLGVSVRAWQERNGLYFKELGQRDTHWCTLYSYVLYKKWFVFDSYDNTLKELEWDYDFGFAKRYWLESKVTFPPVVENEDKEVNSSINGTTYTNEKPLKIKESLIIKVLQFLRSLLK